CPAEYTVWWQKKSWSAMGDPSMTSRRIGFLSLMVLCIAWPGYAVDDKSADTDKPLKDKKEASEKLLKSPTVTGRLVEWGGEQTTIALMVPIQVPNPDGIQHHLDLQRSLAEASMDRNPVNRLSRMADIQRQMDRNKPHMVKEEHVKMVFQPVDDFVIRM